ncbi:MAG TPA: fructose bisphosphate aldolase [Erysipelotrichaceae bacterium]|nr:fructose bisphosphate aldolase [Erysipelotrichaceae bacterium]
MNQTQLKRMHTDKGFIAALDQSGGSTPKALKLYGINEDAYHDNEQMFDLVHQMRTRIIKSPSFSSDHILGAILFEDTMDRKIDGEYSSDYLWNKKNIVPFLKIDKGLAEEIDGVQLMKPIDNLKELLARAIIRNVFGTKMRSVILKPNLSGIEKIVKQQFELAKIIFEAGLVPIIEPEVDIHSVDKAKSEVILKDLLFKELAKLPKEYKVIFKLSIPSVDGFYSDLMKDEHVVRVVALSGGYTREDANVRLTRNPGLIASFSRALSEGLNVSQTEKEFDTLLYKTVLSIYNASIL